MIKSHPCGNIRQSGRQSHQRIDPVQRPVCAGPDKKKESFGPRQPARYSNQAQRELESDHADHPSGRRPQYPPRWPRRCVRLRPHAKVSRSTWKYILQPVPMWPVFRSNLPQRWRSSSRSSMHFAPSSRVLESCMRRRGQRLRCLSYRSAYSRSPIGIASNESESRTGITSSLATLSVSPAA